MKLILPAIVLSFVATSVFAKTITYHSASSVYEIEDAAENLPQSIKDQVAAKNENVKAWAVQNAVTKLEEICIDKHWPSSNQLEITSLNFSPVTGGPVTRGTYYVVKVEAICRK